MDSALAASFRGEQFPFEMNSKWPGQVGYEFYGRGNDNILAMVPVFVVNKCQY